MTTALAFMLGMATGAGVLMAFSTVRKINDRDCCPKCGSGNWNLHDGEDDGAADDSPYGGPKKLPDYYWCDDCEHYERADQEDDDGE